ncbi:unnamed protein product [Miscanthus lutarioriparius]|uniref:Uncharacterized protein n=1 Tax=Miscanthus lutarioriparius TaxID=422564 RepID=A0A811N421_9POAL|nr:unnamed protein product [Miscanthus lutarioriparius]
MGSQSCGSCYVKSILDRMKPRCLEGKTQRCETSTSTARSRAGTRQDTLEDIMYSPQSIEGDALGVPSPRRHSPKVCPLNMDCSYENNSPNVRESFSIDRMSMRSQNSVVRRVSFRSPDESDVFIIPARNDPDEYSTDDESTEDVSEEIDPKKPHYVITRYY